jgi:SAM-dependent methyltransferase
MSVSTAPEQYFAVRYTFDPGRQAVWRAICGYLERTLALGGDVLELGAGYCDFINQVRASSRCAVDLNPQSSRYCAPGVRFVCADVTDLPLCGGRFDVAFASNLLEHLTAEQAVRALRQVSRVLRPGGRLVLVQPNYYYAYRSYWDDFTHVRAYTHVSLPDLLSAHGYAVDRVEKRFLPLTFRGRLPRSYLLTRAYLGLPWRPLAGQMLVAARRA